MEGKESPAKTKMFSAKLRAVWACGEADSAEANTAQSHWFCEYLRENEFLFIRGPDGFDSWKKNLMTHCPFKTFYCKSPFKISYEQSQDLAS